MRHRTLTAIGVLLLSLSLSAQDVNKARALLEQALEALKPGPAVTVIATPAALDAALATAAPGATLTLDPTLVYPTLLTVQGVTLRAATVPDGRMTRDPQLPTFRDGLTLGDGATIIGLEVRRVDPLTDIVVIRGKDVVVDRVRILGDPAKGAKRGIAANGNGNVTIRRSYVADCFGTYPGNDTQAILAYDMAPGLTIEDNYLEGGSETLMLGGADPSSEARTPSNVIIRGNTLTKNPAWQALPIGVKNLVEFKNAKNVLVEDNDGSYSWAKGQAGYLLVVTVRNQDGRAPFSTVQDLTVRNNRFAHGAGAMNLLGQDTIKESASGRDVPVGTVRRSVKGARWTITGNTFTDLDPAKYAPGTTARMILLEQAPDDLTISGNTFQGAKVSAAVYISGGPPAQRFTFTDNTVPPSNYGFFGAGVSAMPTNWTSSNAAWAKFVATGTISGIKVP